MITIFKDRHSGIDSVTYVLFVLRTSNVILIALKLTLGGKLPVTFFDAQAGNASSRWCPNGFIPELPVGLRDSGNVKTFGTGLQTPSRRKSIWNRLFFLCVKITI
jgi:hypothetical protein